MFPQACLFASVLVLSSLSDFSVGRKEVNVELQLCYHTTAKPKNACHPVDSISMSNKHTLVNQGGIFFVLSFFPKIAFHFLGYS